MIRLDEIIDVVKAEKFVEIGFSLKNNIAPLYNFLKNKRHKPNPLWYN